MTSLLPDSARIRADLRHRRPLAPAALLGGAGAAAATLMLCLGVAIMVWFSADAGAHGAPRDALRVGALGWLLGHGSGVRVDGVPVTVVPLGLTVLCAWVLWRVGRWVGESVSGHGPDADAISDGARDWTVPVSSVLLALGYALVVAVTTAVAGSSATAPNGGRAVLWSLVLGLTFGAAGIAVGSGRAAIWVAVLPGSIRAAARICRTVLLTRMLVCLLVLGAALALDLGTAVNVTAQLHPSAGDATVFTLLSAVLVPNAAVFSGAYLLGPGFTVGVGTLVSPTAVSIGALPMFPMLAALPDNGEPAAWVGYLVVLAPLSAAVATLRAQRRMPTTRWSEALLRGLMGGVLAGLCVGVLAGVAGGAVGPGRMSEVGPLALDTCVHAVVGLGLGSVVGALLAVLPARRAARADRDDAAAR